MTAAQLAGNRLAVDIFGGELTGRLQLEFYPKQRCLLMLHLINARNKASAQESSVVFGCRNGLIQ